MTTLPSKEAVNEVEEHTKPAFLRRVRIRGYKSIAFCDVHLQPLTILVGRNAAGKSNFIDALAFLRDVLDGSVAKAVEIHGGWSSLLCRTANRRTIEIEIEASFTCGRARQQVRIDGAKISAPAAGLVPDLEGRDFIARYLLEVEAGQQGAAHIRREQLDLTDHAGKLTRAFDLQGGSVDIPAGGTGDASITTGVLAWNEVPDWPAFPKKTGESLLRHRFDQTLLGSIGYPPFLDLGDSLRWMGFYNIHPDAVRQLEKPLLGVLLKKDGRNLASVIDGLKIDPDSVQRVQDYLATISEEVERFDVVAYGEYETVRFRLRTAAGRPPLEFDAASMSDGTLRALAALLAAFQIVLPYGHPSVIGIEEPETALHPAAMRALVDALDEATQHTQVLLTTHSADLLSGRDVKPGQVLVVRNRGGQTQITPVDPASREIIDKELYSLADLQRMDRLDLDEADLNRQARLGNGAEGD